MKINARLPFLVRGTPVRNNGPRDIFVSWDFEWDIPEVSLSEVEIAFENFSAFEEHRDPERPYVATHRFGQIDSHTVAIKYDGALYRRISRPGDHVPALFQHAFCEYDGDGYNGLHTDISMLERRPDRRLTDPAALPVFKHLFWRLKCESYAGHRDQQTWPQSIRIPEHERIASGTFWKRNFVTFEQVLPKIVEFSHDHMQECLRIYQAHMEKFILVDSELLMKSRPPVYRVERNYESYEKASVTVDISFAPDWQETHLPTGYFDLNARDEAFEYATILRDNYAKRKVPDEYSLELGNVYDLTTTYLAHDPEILTFDHHAEELRRISSGMAAEAWRYIMRNPSWIDKFGQQAVDDVHKAFAEVRATNYILGEYGDPSDWLESTVSVWKRARRPEALYHMDNVPISDMLIERAMRYEENKPISVSGITMAPLR